MTDESPLSEAALSEELRQRFAADIAAGRTIALPAADLARADLRAHLPEVLESLMPQGNDATRLQIPDYTVLGEIGHGGMSTVYLASHNKLRRYVALKIVPNWLGGQDRARERMLKEAQAMARVAHPNIVTIHDIIDTGDTVAIAMEWIDGLTLAGLLRTLPDKATSVDMVVMRTSLGTPQGVPNQLEATTTRTFARMMADIARAVHCVHQNGLLHLDIKPSNVLVRRNGTPLLADFGVVREMDLALTHTRSFAGTPIYAAPEQLRREDAAFGARTDVYGLGITLYELIARVQPLRQESLTKVLQDIQAGRIPPLSSHAEVPHDLENIVHKAISPELSKRYPTAQALADDLQAFLDGRAVAARPLSRPERIGRWARAEPWKALVTAVLTITIPVSCGLAIKLLAEQPRIQAGRMAELTVAHDQLAQRGFQELLGDSRDAGPHVNELIEARKQDPNNATILACLLSALGFDHPDQALAEIDKVQGPMANAKGLRILREKFQAGRLFFTQEEIKELHASNERLDTLLLIMDRILWADEAEDWSTLDGELGIIKKLDLQVLVGKQDPLLLGLRALAASRMRSREKMQESCQALVANWGNDPTAQTWRILALAHIDRRSGVQAANDLLQQMPENPAILCLLSRIHSFAGEWKEALETIERCPSDDRLSQPTLLSQYASALGGSGQVQKALDLLPADAPDCHSALRLRLEGLKNPVEALNACKVTLRSGRPTLDYARSASELAINARSAKDIEFIARQALQYFPDSPWFRVLLAKIHGDRKDYDQAEMFLGDLRIPDQLVDTLCPTIARGITKRKNWPKLLTLCEHWRACTEGEQYRLEYYRGLALVRLELRERYEEARHCFDEHFRIAGARLRDAAQRASTSGNPPPKPFHYAEALFEDLWTLVDPKLPKEKQLPTLSSHHWPDAKMEGLAQESAWWSLVVAYAYAANGQQDQARTWAKAAKARLPQQNPNDLSPPADLAARIDDAIARFQ